MSFYPQQAILRQGEVLHRAERALVGSYLTDPEMERACKRVNWIRAEGVALGVGLPLAYHCWVPMRQKFGSSSSVNKEK